MNQTPPAKTIEAAKLRIFKMFAKDLIEERDAEKFLSFINRFEHPLFSNDYNAMLDNFLAQEISIYGNFDEETFTSKIVFPEQRFIIARNYIQKTSVLKNGKMLRLADITKVDIDWQELLAPAHIFQSEFRYLLQMDADNICRYLSDPKYQNIVSAINKKIGKEPENQ